MKRQMMQVSVPLILVTGLILFLGCGKPNDPEVLTPVENSNVVGRLITPGNAQDLVKQDSLIYIAQGEGGLLIVNVANPEHPEIVSMLTENVRGYSTKIAKKDSVVYLAAGSFGLTVVNIARADTPFVTVSNLNMKPAKDILIRGKFLLTPNSEKGITIAGISYPEQPDIRGSLETPGYANGATVSADTTLLFVACGEMGLAVLNIADFQDGYPAYELLGWCDTPGYAEDVVLDEQRHLAFVSSGTAGIQILDYSALTNIHIVGKIDPGGYAKELVYKEHRVYFTAETNGFFVYDVTDPLAPNQLLSMKTEDARGLTLDDHYIYIADQSEGLIIVAKPD